MRRVSNSEIQDFKRCRRRWWLAYFRKLRPKRDKVRKPRESGSMVHSALHRWYADGKLGDPIELLLADAAEMEAEFPDQEPEIAKIVELAKIMVEGYLEWLEETGADAHLEVIAPEQEVSCEIPDLSEPVLLMGKLDVRVRNLETGAREVLETKTVNNFADRIKLAPIDEQIYMYQLLERLLDEPERSDGVILNMLRRVKRTKAANPPFYMRHPVHHNDEELKGFYVQTHGTIQEMLRLEGQLAAGADPRLVAYPTPAKSCEWECDFYKVCPMLNDPQASGERLLEMAFETHDPMARYGKVPAGQGGEEA